MKTEQLKIAVLFAATKDVRYYLNGIHLKRDPRSGTRLSATDGHAMIRVTDTAQRGDDWETIVPLDLIKAVIASKCKEFDLTQDGTTLTASWHGGSASAAAIDGRFPDCDMIIQHVDEPSLTPTSISPALLAKLAKLPTNANTGVTLSLNAESSGIFGIEHDAFQIAGVVMPMRTRMSRSAILGAMS